MKWTTLFNIFWRNLPQVLVYNYFHVKNYYWQRSYSYYIFVVENNTGIFQTKWNIWFSYPLKKGDTYPSHLVTYSFWLELYTNQIPEGNSSNISIIIVVSLSYISSFETDIVWKNYFCLIRNGYELYHNVY